MQKETTTSFETLHRSIKELRAEEHETCLKLLVLLGTFENEKYFRDAGYSSLFNFLVSGLRYSRPAASRRLAAARAIRDYPLAYELLETYRVSLTTLSLVSASLTPENAEEILRGIADKINNKINRKLQKANECL